MPADRLFKRSPSSRTPLTTTGLRCPRVKTLPSDVLKFFKEQGAKGGRIGGKRRLETMTASKRSAVARKAAKARWSKKRTDA
jgi:uncharacterized protein YdaU (DUF1376 family)